MLFYANVMELMQRYLLTRDTDALKELAELVKSEQDNPMLQEATLKVPLTVADFNRAATAGFIKLSVETVDSEQAVYEDKLIRVFCSDAGDVPTHICMVAHLDDEFVKLVPMLETGPEGQQ